MQDAMNCSKFRLVTTLLSKIQDDVKIQATNEQGQNLFHTLAIYGRNGDIETVQQIVSAFLARGVSFKAKDRCERLPLHYAVQYKFSWLIQKLVQLGSPVNEVDVFGKTPLIYCLEGQNILSTENTLETLLRNGADL